jgi:hypothetical protein
MKKLSLFILFALLAITNLVAQEHNNEEHISGKGFRIAAVLGHTYINSNGMDGNLYIPSWGLDIDYWFNHKWGIGLHNDIEIENFVVERNDTEIIQRENPLVFTLDALYEIGNGFVISLGPGIELEKNESFFLARIGLDYEYDINKNFYLMPNIFHDQRFDGFSTTSIGLGLGHKF